MVGVGGPKFWPRNEDGDGARVFLNAYNRSTVADMWLLLDTNKKSYMGSDDIVTPDLE